MSNLDDLGDVVLRLAQYGFARDRATDREVRTITITDDEALLILTALGALDHPLMRRLGEADS